MKRLTVILIIALLSCLILTSCVKKTMLNEPSSSVNSPGTVENELPQDESGSGESPEVIVQPTDAVENPLETPAVNGVEDSELQPAPTETTGQSNTPASQPTATTTPPATTPPKAVDPLVREILTLAGKKVKSYEYVYVEPPYQTGKDVYSVMGNRVKVTLGDFRKESDKIYDTVYLDTKAATGIATCENPKHVLCRDSANIEYTMKYSDWIKTLPHEWLARIEYAEFKGSETIEQRDSVKLVWTYKGQPARIWIDEHYGLPVVIEIGPERSDKLEVHRFKSLRANTMDEQQMLPPRMRTPEERTPLVATA